MDNIVRFFSRFERKTLLIVGAVLLLLLNIGRLVDNSFEARQVELESKSTRLEQYRKISARVGELDKKLARLLKQKKQAEKHFFTGATDDKITSAMQLRIQSLVGRAGMQSESIRPIRQKAKEAKDSKDKDSGAAVFGEVLIKARLVGSISSFMDFMASLYKGNEFFRVENFSMKPYRKSGLKIFIELRGYYLLPAENQDSDQKVVDKGVAT
ncbi:MAG: GspMb/PilO family protein [Thermodesulfobacteriota bacterium]